MDGLVKTIGFSNEEKNNFGRNRFADNKDDALDDFDEYNDISAERAREITNEMLSKAVSDLKFSYGRVKERLTPAFIKRYRNKKIHIAQVSEADR